MIASKVGFTQHTRELLNARPLSRTDKSRIRKQRIIEYIREVKYGECQKSDLIAAAGWDISNGQQYSNGWSFVDRLIKNKVIQMSDGSNSRNTYIKKWVVLADVHTVKVENGKMTVPPQDGETTLGPVEIKKDGFVSPRPPLQLEPVIPADDATIDLVSAAKDFAWNTNSDSLREFVAWVKR
jgi:hypothetical protein